MTSVLHAAFEEYRTYDTDGAFDATVLDAERIRERFAFAACAPRVFVSTTPFLHEAIALYERCGFVRCPDPHHALHGTPLFTLEKWLTGPPVAASCSKT